MSMQVDFMDADDMAVDPEVEREQWIPELEPRKGWRGRLWARRPESQGVIEGCQISDGVSPAV